MLIEDNKVLVFNECYSSNFGDQAINLSLKALLTDHGIKSESIYLSKPKINTLPDFNYGKCAAKTSNNIAKLIKGVLYFFYWYITNQSYLKQKIALYNTFIIGGGQLFITGKKFYPNTFSIALFWITRLIKRKPENKIIFLGVGSARKHTIIEKLLFRYVLSHATEVYVRDQFSQEVIEKTYKISSKVIPDLVFYKPEITNKDKSIALVFITDFKKIKKICGNKMLRENYYKYLITQINEYHCQGLHVSFCYTTKEDACEAQSFQKHYSSCHQRFIPIEYIKNLSELINLLRKTKKLNASRMHALILGKKFGCEVKPHIISDKISSFADEYLGKENSILHKQLKELF